jgi:thiamine kinase-like enzyme
VEKSIEEALGGVPGWANVEYRSTLLSGGLTNRSFLIERGSERFVLRLNAPHTESFALDRETELRIRKTAALHGLAAEVIHSDIEEGVLLSAYLPGKIWSPADLKDTTKLEQVAELLRKVHAMPLSGTTFSAESAAQSYIDAIGFQGPWLSMGERCSEIIRRNFSDVGHVCCHNDPVPENIVESSTLMLLDWEYAADNDAYFDLAVVISHHQLPETRSDILLDAYAGGITAERRQRLHRQQRVYDALLWLWLAARNVATNDSRIMEELASIGRRLERDD